MLLLSALVALGKHALLPILVIAVLLPPVRLVSAGLIQLAAFSAIRVALAQREKNALSSTVLDVVNRTALILVTLTHACATPPMRQHNSLPPSRVSAVLMLITTTSATGDPLAIVYVALTAASRPLSQVA